MTSHTVFWAIFMGFEREKSGTVRILKVVVWEGNAMSNLAASFESVPRQSSLGSDQMHLGPLARTCCDATNLFIQLHLRFDSPTCSYNLKVCSSCYAISLAGQLPNMFLTSFGTNFVMLCCWLAHTISTYVPNDRQPTRPERPSCALSTSPGSNFTSFPG